MDQLYRDLQRLTWGMYIVILGILCLLLHI